MMSGLSRRYTRLWVSPENRFARVDDKVLQEFMIEGQQMVYLLPLFVVLGNSKTKSKPAGRVPPDAILLSGNKSMQKCLLLAEGY